MDSPVVSAKKIIAEVEKWSDDLASKPRWLILNKVDRLQEDEGQQAYCQTIVDGSAPK
jgi:GTP-binding protein